MKQFGLFKLHLWLSEGEKWWENKTYAKQSFSWHYQTFLFMAINVATVLILHPAQLNSFLHIYIK